MSRGDAEIYLRLPRPGKRYEEKIWDHAAGVVVVEEAGGRVTDVYGKPLDFSQGRTLKENTGEHILGKRRAEQRGVGWNAKGNRYKWKKEKNRGGGEGNEFWSCIMARGCWVRALMRALISSLLE